MPHTAGLFRVNVELMTRAAITDTERAALNKALPEVSLVPTDNYLMVYVRQFAASDSREALKSVLRKLKRVLPECPAIDGRAQPAGRGWMPSTSTRRMFEVWDHSTKRPYLVRTHQTIADAVLSARATDVTAPTWKQHYAGLRLLVDIGSERRVLVDTPEVWIELVRSQRAAADFDLRDQIADLERENARLRDRIEQVSLASVRKRNAQRTGMTSPRPSASKQPKTRRKRKAAT